VVNDLNKVSTDPVVIGSTSLNILLYADDIVLLSQSKEGLQSSLNILHNFCSSWKLQVNTSKSKIIVFNSNGKSFLNCFSYNNILLETVTSYCYLQNNVGIVLKYNGNFGLATETLMDKARKAYFKIKKTVGLDNSCGLLEKLFDSLVSPILLYGSEVWGVDCKFKDSDLTEKST